MKRAKWRLNRSLLTKRGIHYGSETKKEISFHKRNGSKARCFFKTLRYYDSIGIFKADYVDPDTGYRYYDPQQYEKLGTILELRSLNFSLNEIKGYFTERNMKNLWIC